MRKYKYLIPAIFWTSLITFLSLISIENGPELPFSFSDKIIHAVMYFIFAACWFFGFSRRKISNFLYENAMLISVLFAIVYGVLIEIMQQTLVENRHGDWQDALANTIGAIVAGILIKYLGSKTIKLKTKN